MNWKILLLIIASLILYWIWGSHWEERARENFNEHFPVFEKLEQMQHEDIHAFFIGHPREGAAFAGRGLSKERWAEYLKLLDEANLSYMIYVNDEPKKRMVRFHDDLKGDGGYVYMEYPPPKFFNSFEKCEPIMPSESCYIVLRKNWYLFTENYRLEQTDAK